MAAGKQITISTHRLLKEEQANQSHKTFPRLMALQYNFSCPCCFKADHSPSEPQIEQCHCANRHETDTEMKTKK